MFRTTPRMPARRCFSSASLKTCAPGCILVACTVMMIIWGTDTRSALLWSRYRSSIAARGQYVTRDVAAPIVDPLTTWSSTTVLYSPRSPTVTRYNISTDSSSTVYVQSHKRGDHHTVVPLSIRPAQNTTSGHTGRILPDIVGSRTVIPDKMMRMHPEILQDFPTTFLKDYKNPCYRKDQRLHCLPYFFLLGTPKSGTTDIWSKIVHHPDIVAAAKEPHWWTRQSYHSVSLASYELQFMTKAIERETVKVNDSRRWSVITGDGSASTFWDNSKWEKFFPDDSETGPPYILADVIHTVLPNAKLVVSLRDPTERLYSDYIYFRASRSTSAEHFHNLVKWEIAKFKTCVAERSHRACAYAALPHSPIRLHIGLYSLYTYDWLQRYPRDQFLALKLEEWNANCTTILPEIYDFLEVAELSPDDITRICTAMSKNVNRRKVKYGPMFNSTRTLLREFYQPYIEDLSNLLQDKKFLWDYNANKETSSGNTHGEKTSSTVMNTGRVMRYVN